MLRSTFQLAAGVGPTREQALWRHGVACWADLESMPSAPLARAAPATAQASSAPIPAALTPDFPAAFPEEGAVPERFIPARFIPEAAIPRPAPAPALPPPIARLQPALGALRAAVEAASAALAAGDVEEFAALVPAGEHWRLFGEFGQGAAYLDIETSDDVVGHAGISAIGVVDRHGPHLFLAGRDLEQFPEAMRASSLLVTFNGLTFDVPILRRAFPDWQPPRAHIDLRHVLGRLGHRDTLKQLEERLPALHLGRPDHLRALAGSGASALFHRGRNGDREALRHFAEYNLYDAVNLRTLMAYAYNGLVAQSCTRAPALQRVTRPVPVPTRGDLLYDISKLLLAL